MGFKRRCPFAPLCLGHQHIPVHLHKRSSFQLCGSRTSPSGVVLQARPSCRLLPPLLLPPLPPRGRPARTVGCSDATSDPVPLWAPQRVL